MNIDALIKQYHDELYDRVIPFWLDKSQDKEFGGFFTCLNRDGEVFDTDKFLTVDRRHQSGNWEVAWMNKDVRQAIKPVNPGDQKLNFPIKWSNCSIGCAVQ